MNALPWSDPDADPLGDLRMTIQRGEEVMRMIELSNNPPAVGDHVLVTDEQGVRHDGLVTVYFGGDKPNGSLNAVYVSADATKTDPYGRQVERLSSTSHKSTTGTTPGRFWQ